MVQSIRHVPQRVKLPVIHGLRAITHEGTRPLNPGAAHAHLPRRVMIVKLALRRLQDLRLFEAKVFSHARQHVLKVAAVGLVAADVLGGDDEVKGHALQRAGVAARKRLAVDVGQDHELVVLAQPPEGVHRVRERGPAAARLAKGLALLGWRRGQAEGGGDLGVDGGEQVAVLHVGGRGLLLDFFVVVDFQQPFAVNGEVVGLEERLQAVDDAGLPVDEGAVDVE